MNGLFSHLNLKPSNPLTLEALTNKLRERELHYLPDVTIPLNEVRVDDNLNLIIPETDRTFALNGHSKQQLNSLLGFRYDKWFESAETDVKRDELNTRLKRASSTVKFRLTDYNDTATADGTVAGIVTPGFQPINDSIVTTVLGFNIGHNCKILRANITEQTTEYVIAFGAPENQYAVGEIFKAIGISNSNTGAASFNMKMMFVRVACQNGLVVPAFNNHGQAASLLINRKHTGKAIEEVLDRLHDSVTDISERFRNGIENLYRASGESVSDPLKALQYVVKNAHQPQKLAQELLQTSFAKEPMMTKLGIVRAITDHDTHEALGLTQEARRDLEQSASNFIGLPYNQSVM
ncbi:MAG: DUF932 domain-containing protein [Candidatus Riflebacteria bacterium]|nr:DUF932 domain-containing protein [Candidatus Riflebacteria bacterium]